MNLLALFAACVPCVAVAAHVRSRLLAANGSARGLWRTFLLGALSTLAVLAAAPVLEQGSIFPGGTYGRAVEAALLRAALPEESAKFLVLVLFAVRFGHVTDKRTGVAHGIVASLGFAGVETALYTAEGGLASAAIRTCTTLPCHAVLGAMMGWYVGRAVSSAVPGRRALASGLAVPALVHFGYDFPLMAFLGMHGERVVPTPAETIFLSLLVTITLASAAIAGLRLYRSSFPRPRRGADVVWSFAYAAPAMGTGLVASLLIPVGGIVASAGAWIVGSLLFVDMPHIDALPNARTAVATTYALGAALLCFGLSFAFRGIRARRARDIARDAANRAATPVPR